MPDTLHRKHLVIVGCGAAAVILLANLAKQSTAVDAPLLAIRIIDDSPSVPCGLAYSVSHPAFILNVPAQRMGAFVDNPAHFYQWLQNTGQWRDLRPEFSTLVIRPDDFVPRMLYGAYLQHLFYEAIARLKADGHNIELIAERVVAVEHASCNDELRTQGLCVVTHRNKRFPADALVMATGNCPDFDKPDSPHLIFPSPYCMAANQCDWKNQRDLVVIGSGLSMVDAVQFTIAQGFGGQFHIFSAHNLSPLPHSNTHHHHQLPEFQTMATSAVSLLRDIRAYIQSNQQQGMAWQDSINYLRTGNNLIWSNLPDRERSRLRKCLPWWNIARHRIPANIAQQLDKLKVDGRLRMYKAKIKRIDAVTNGIQLTLANNNLVNNNLVNNKKLAPNELHQTIKVRTDKAVICTGYLPGFQRVQSLCAELLNDENQLRMTLGKPEQDFLIATAYEIYGIGPALGGVLFETTAIQEIRQQAQRIAHAIYTKRLLASPSSAQTTITLITPAL